MAEDLIQTMRFDPVDGMPELEPCLARMAAEAGDRGYSFDRHDLRNELQAATFRVRDHATITVRIAASGAVAVVVTPDTV